MGLRYEEALHGFQFHGSVQAAAALEQSPGVVSVEADTALYLQEKLPFGIERIEAYEPENPNGAYQQGFRGAGARIAVLDTGIDLDHPDLVDSIDGALGKNCLNLHCLRTTAMATVVRRRNRRSSAERRRGRRRRA